MKKKRNLIIIGVLFMVVGFAAVTTTLYLNGIITIGTSDDFSVIFSNAVLDGTDISTSAISDDKKTITFDTNDLVSKGDTSVLDYEISNNSTQYNSEIDISCSSADGNFIELANTYDNFIYHNSTGVGKLVVKLKQVSLNPKEVEVHCTLNAKAVERETDVIEPQQVVFEPSDPTWEVHTVNEALEDLIEKVY